MVVVPVTRCLELQRSNANCWSESGEGVKDQMYIAGTLQNTPENLMRWIQDPQQVRPRTAMPNLGVGPTMLETSSPISYDQRNTGPSM